MKKFSAPHGQFAPAIHIVLELEGEPVVEVHAWNVGDEARLLDYIAARRDRLGREILDALDAALKQLDTRTARLTAGDFGRRAA
ncbi:MAG: hypothetical protein ABSC51_06140 [Gaiellaceae bacterium]